MEWLDEILENPLVMSILVILVGAVVWLIVERFFNKVIKKNAEINRKDDYKSRRRSTYFRLVRSAIRYAIVILVILALLAVNGVDVTSILVSIGVVTVVAGLALQDALKDIIMGFNLVTDGFFSVGDVLQLQTPKVQAEVLELGMKSTRLRDVGSGDIIVIANRNIAQAQVVSRDLVVAFPLPYSVGAKKAGEFIEKVAREAEKLELIKSARAMGVDELGESLVCKVMVEAEPKLHGAAKRATNRVVLEVAEAERVDLPDDPTDVRVVK